MLKMPAPSVLACLISSAASGSLRTNFLVNSTIAIRALVASSAFLKFGTSLTNITIGLITLALTCFLPPLASNFTVDPSPATTCLIKFPSSSTPCFSSSENRNRLLLIEFNPTTKFLPSLINVLLSSLLAYPSISSLPNAASRIFQSVLLALSPSPWMIKNTFRRLLPNS